MNILVTAQPASPSLAAAPAGKRPLVRIVIVGHVDHGKSTLIGRLLYETGSLPDGKLESLKAVSARRGMPFEWSFLLDALQTERDQGITLDTSQIRFRTPARDFVLIDAPGHAEFLRNMITGAAQADAALTAAHRLQIASSAAPAAQPPAPDHAPAAASLAALSFPPTLPGRRQPPPGRPGLDQDRRPQAPGPTPPRPRRHRH